MSDPSKRKQNRLHEGRYTRGLSPLMIRVMLVNLLAVFTLAGGVLYVNQVRDELLDRRIETLSVQAGIIAAALGEASADEENIDPAVARPIIARLVGPTQMRALLFNTDGRVVIDSRFLSGDKTVFTDQLPALNTPDTLWTSLQKGVFDALDYFADAKSYPPYQDRQGMTAADLPEVARSLEGYPTQMIRQKASGQPVIHIAIPVQRLRRVLGSIQIIAETGDIEDLVREEQIAIIKVVLISFALTVLVSLFLGMTLAIPIRRLAKAAIRVRRGIGREETLPEFSDRRDEIGDLSRALSDMMRALYNQIDAVERFAADVAHELKNPLTSMRSALETLKRTDRADHKERLLLILEDDVKRLDRLIGDISDASRLDAELTRAKMGPIDLRKLITMQIEGYRTTACKDGPRLLLDASDKDEYQVQGIEARLGQVWRNLIDNAITFTPKDKSITVRLVRGNRMLTVFVEDEGTGLPTGAEDKIFKRFYSDRPDHDNPDDFAGISGHSGLGLAISKQVVEAHGGTINASTITEKDDQGEEQAVGARFEVRLPLAQ